MEIFWIKMPALKNRNLKNQPQQQQDNLNIKDNMTKKTYQNPLKQNVQFKTINKKAKTKHFQTSQK